MGVYVGCVEKKSGYATNFFNFKPIFEIINGQIKELTDTDLEHLLPESVRRNINLYLSLLLKIFKIILKLIQMKEILLVTKFKLLTC
mgnify:CR=1 FL=1